MPIQTKNPFSARSSQSGADRSICASPTGSDTCSATYRHSRIPRAYYRKDDSHITSPSVDSPFTCASVLADPGGFHSRRFPSQILPPSPSSHYHGVIFKDTVGTLTLTNDRLVFKPLNKQDKERNFAWLLEGLQKNRITLHRDDCLLKLVSTQYPSAAILKFPSRNALEGIHYQLTHKTQPMSKQRKLKETLVTTQRKLKEANKTIDELQDTNQTLLETCEKFAKKCQSLTVELQQLRREQTASHATRDKLLEGQQLANLQALVERLKNEKTAREIEYEMDTQDWTHRLTNMERDLQEERAAMERMLEERQPMDELRLEVSMLAKQNWKERQTNQQLRDQIGKIQQEEMEVEERMWQAQRQRNNVFLELAQVKMECDRLRRDLLGQWKKRQIHTISHPALHTVEANTDDNPSNDAEYVCTWRTTPTAVEDSVTVLFRTFYCMSWPVSFSKMKVAFEATDQRHTSSSYVALRRGWGKHRTIYQGCTKISAITTWNTQGYWIFQCSPFSLFQPVDFRTEFAHSGRGVIKHQHQGEYCLPDNTPVGKDVHIGRTEDWSSCWWDSLVSDSDNLFDGVPRHAPFTITGMPTSSGD